MSRERDLSDDEMMESLARSVRADEPTAEELEALKPPTVSE